MRKYLIAAAIVLLVLGGIIMAGCSKKDNNYDRTLKTDNEIDFSAYIGSYDGETDLSAAFETAIGDARTAGKGIYLPAGRYLIQKAVTVPEDVYLKFEEGAVIVIDSTRKILSVTGEIVAGNWQIFEGNGLLKGITRCQSTGNPVWFGAKGDGVTDDTAAFKLAWSLFSQLDVPYSEKGYVLGEISSFKNMVLNGCDKDRKTIIKALPGTEKLFKIVAPGYVTINNISFDLADMPDGSTVFYYDTTQYLEYFYLTNCDFTDAYNVFTDAKSTSLMMFMHFEDCNFYRGRAQTFDIEDFEGFIFMKRILIDNSESYTHHNLKAGIKAIDIDDVRGTIFEDITVIGGGTEYSDEMAFYIPGEVQLMASLWWDRVTVKNMGGYAIYLKNTTLCSFIHVNIDNCGGGMRLSNSWDLQLEDVNVTNITSGNGVYVVNSTTSQLCKVTCSNIKKNGVFLSGGDYVTVTDCTMTGCGEYGYSSSNCRGSMIVNSTAEGQKGNISIADSSKTSSAYNVVCNGETVSGTGNIQK